MKKIVIIAIIFALLLGGFFAFFKLKQSKILPSQAEIGNHVDARALDSFRGVIASDFERPVAQPSSESGSSLDQKEEILPEAEGPVRTELVFALLGDTQSFEAGSAKGNFQKAVLQIRERNPDLVIAVGDLVSNCEGNNASRVKFNDWKNTLGTIASKTYAVQGNHDRSEDGSGCDKIWQEVFDFPTNGPSGFSEKVYSFDFGNSHFVFLDSDNPEEHKINKPQRDWLDNDLAKNKKENNFVFFHEPAYPVSDKMRDSLDVFPSDRNTLWEILDRHNVTAVFNGHEHIVSRRKITSSVSSVAKNSIYQFGFGNTDSFDHGLPAAGVAEYANQGQGRFGLVKVDGKEITVETRSPDGTLLNTFTFSK